MYRAQRTLPAREGECRLAQVEDSSADELGEEEEEADTPCSSASSCSKQSQPEQQPSMRRVRRPAGSGKSKPDARRQLDRLRLSGLRPKTDRSASLQPYSPLQLAGSPSGPRWRPDGQTPLAARPTTCYGLVPTPQVSMGACFFNVFHDCQLRVNCVASWVHPANRKQFLLLGAEEGIFTLNLTELHENTLNQVSLLTELFERMHTIFDQ